MSADPETRLRADARRNRDQILAAARTIFAEQGPDVPMEDIAKAAGVGVGTLYRRFPDREALIGAVARENIARVLDDARAAQAEEPTAWAALVRILRETAELRLSVQLSLLSATAAEIIRNDPMTAKFRRSLLEELDAVVHAAQREGELRADVDTGDVATLFSLMLRQLPSRYKRGPRIDAERSLALMLDGLRARPGSPLPGRPLSLSDITF